LGLISVAGSRRYIISIVRRSRGNTALLGVACGAIGEAAASA
jgi:hypothetical protein